MVVGSWSRWSVCWGYLDMVPLQAEFMLLAYLAVGSVISRRPATACGTEPEERRRCPLNYALAGL